MTNIEPLCIQNGLAVYRLGSGMGEDQQALLMPYPHGFHTAPAACGALAMRLVELGRQVITFDPPGSYASTRPARVDQAEMVECALEALRIVKILSGPSSDPLNDQIPTSIDVVGHSMGGLSALALALDCPQAVRRMALVGSEAGGLSIRRGRGIPYGWSYLQPDFWRFIFWGMKLSSGRGNMALQMGEFLDKPLPSPHR